MQSEKRNNNLLIAVLGLVVCALSSSVFTALSCDFVLDSFQSSNCMALIISDTGIKSDDLNLEHQLSSATIALQTIRDFGYALAIGSFGVLVAVLVRIRRQNAS